MSELYLTAYDGAILGPIAKALGWVMDKIYIFFYSVFGIENVAVSIVVFTLVIYMCLFPLTYKQQKFSALNRVMQPEIKAIQAKYKGKRDNESVQAQQEETKKVYDKYGVSATGSCIQLLIQMPILFALYRVFYNVPAYITSIKNIFVESINDNIPIVEGIVNTDGFMKKMQTVFENASIRNLSADFTGMYTSENATAIKNSIVDVLYKLGTNGWSELKLEFPNLSNSIDAVIDVLEKINYVFVLNISDTPWNQIQNGWNADSKNWALIICALLIPLLAWGTQMVNILLMPNQSTGGQEDQMARSMKTMNKIMPLMSLFIAFTCPVGLGLYWIAGSCIRIVQQFFLNMHFKKLDVDDIIEKNKEKAEKKAEKRSQKMEALSEKARINTKGLSMNASTSLTEEQEADIEKINELRNNAPAGSMTAIANSVKEFNERNSKNNKNNSKGKNKK